MGKSLLTIASSLMKSYEKKTLETCENTPNRNKKSKCSNGPHLPYLHVRRGRERKDHTEPGANTEARL